MRIRAFQLEGLDEGIIPIEVAIEDSDHRQYLTTAAYEFTDYRSQGQT